MEKHRGGVKSTWRRRRAPLRYGRAVYLSGFPPPASPPLVVLYCVVLLCCLVYRESSTPARRCFPSAGFTGAQNQQAPTRRASLARESVEESVSLLHVIEAQRQREICRSNECPVERAEIDHTSENSRETKDAQSVTRRGFFGSMREFLKL